MDNPAQDGIDAAKEDARKRLFMEKLIEEFKAFTLEAMSDGLFVNLDEIATDDDHLNFMRNALETFISLKEDENGEA